jgi:hypothetical protein
MYITRAAESTALQISDSFPVLLVTGPRQVGKSTMLQHIASNDRTVITLDDIDVRYLAKTDPALFMQRYEPPLLIDEIQYAPELLPYIKMAVDKSQKNGEYWLTGSQAFHLMKGVSESLAGRVGIMNMLGLSAAEISGQPSVPFTLQSEYLTARAAAMSKMSVTDVFNRIFTGAMPRLYSQDNISRDAFYSSYIQTYLMRDVRDLTQVGDELAFYNFMVIVAARTAKPVVYEEIAQEAGISAPTVKKWMSILVTSGIVALVQPYSNNALKRVTRMPLLHFMDTGLAAYLLKWTSAEALERGAMSGAFFESYVFAEVYKSYINAGMQPPLYYYRDKDKREIDLLLYQDGVLNPIEVKKAASPARSATKNFSMLVNALPKDGGVQVGSGGVVCLANDLLPIDANNWRIPVWLI